jgi:hypothetical protein
LAYIIQNIRIMRYFLKTVLSKDQRTLLKLKSKEIVPSDDPDKPSKDKTVKKLNKKLLMETYIDFMQKKEITKEDSNLFKVLGLTETHDLLVRQKKIKE